MGNTPFFWTYQPTGGWWLHIQKVPISVPQLFSNLSPAVLGWRYLEKVANVGTVPFFIIYLWRGATGTFQRCWYRHLSFRSCLHRTFTANSYWPDCIGLTSARVIRVRMGFLSKVTCILIFHLEMGGSSIASLNSGSKPDTHYNLRGHA